MRLYRMINSTPIHVLVDSGADNNFLNPQLASTLG